MQIVVNEVDGRGFSVAIGGEHFHAEPSNFLFPQDVWSSFEGKQTLINELAYVTLLTTPILLDHPRIHFSTPPPRYIQTYHDYFEAAIPNLVEWIPRESTMEILEKFRGVERTFAGSDIAPLLPKQDEWNKKRVILPLSFGKDSLLSLATLHHLGYEVIPVNMDEVIQPRWDKIRGRLIERLEEKFGLKTERVTNELQMLSDYQVLGCAESRLYQMQVHFSYLMAMLPFCYHYQAPTVILSNEYVNSLNKVHREGYLTAHKVMQSWEGNTVLNEVASSISQEQVSAVSLIQGLGNFAIHRLLHEVFPEFGNLRVSCHMEMSDHDRWCHNCERCAQAYVYTLATGQDPLEMGFEASMLSEEKAEHFRLFASPPAQEDEFRHFVRDEERLAFYMAYLNGAEGELMERFKESYLSQTENDASELKQRVFRHYGGSEIGVAIEAAQLYEELLAKYRS